VIPEDTFPGRRMLAVKIFTIQVGFITAIEPPGALTNRSTAARILVIVTIFGGERRATVIGKRVASSSYKNHIKRENYTMATDIKQVNLVENFGIKLHLKLALFNI